VETDPASATDEPEPESPAWRRLEDQIAWYDDFLVMTERPIGGEEGRGKREEDKP